MFCSIKDCFSVDKPALGYPCLRSNSEKNRSRIENPLGGFAETDYTHNKLFSDSKTKNPGVL